MKDANQFTIGLVFVSVTAIVLFALLVDTPALINKQDSLQPSTEYREIPCDSIEQSTRGNLVCQINLQYEDDNIRVFKGKGSIDD